MPPRDRAPAATGRRRGADPAPSALNRYLLDSERLVFAVRRHSAVLAGATCVYLLLLFVAFLFFWFAGGSGAIATTGLVVLLGASGWFGWKVGDWWVERFTVTDRRVLLVSGLLTRRVAIMPLRKVTDLTFERSFTGRVFGYGAFVMESAGQQQALSRIDFLPRPESLYLQMSDLLFGSGGADYDPDEDGGSPRPPRSGRRNDRARRVPPPPPASPPPPVDDTFGATVRLPGQVRSPGSGAASSATAPLPPIARSGPVARRPRGRQGDVHDDPPGRADRMP